MIVSRHGNTLRLVTQPDHAALAGAIFALWRDGGAPTHPRRQDLLLAVREHDNGWREPDAAPRLDPATGGPLDFRDFPREERFALWHRAIDRLSGRPWAAALVAHHAIEIHRGRDPEVWAGFFSEIEARRDELLAAAEAEPAQLLADYAWLDRCDSLSLAACGAFGETGGTPRAIGDLHLRIEGSELVLDPFPLAGATTFEVAVRRIPARRYADAVELVTELARARWRREEIRLRPAGP